MIVLCGSSLSLTAQERRSNFSIKDATTILRIIKDDVKKNYYDPNYRGINLDEHFKAAEEKLKGAQSVGQMMGIIAQALFDFDDTHLVFIPPMRADQPDYGWQMQMIGEKCYVTKVSPDSRAEAEGLKPGDEILAVNGFRPSRSNISKMLYTFYLLRPQPALTLDVQRGSESPRRLEIAARIVKGEDFIDLSRLSVHQVDLLLERSRQTRLNSHRSHEEGEELFIWKMPRFNLSEAETDTMMAKVRKHRALILDLRGNSGGAIITLIRLISNLFDRKIKVDELRERRETRPEFAPAHSRPFTGKVIVLVDSRSASAAEVLARVIQLEKRGLVIGDRTAGAVMQSIQYHHELGMETVLHWDVNITVADVIMSDGKSLEKNGVTPDELVLPTAADLAAKRDPVMARAAALLGVRLDPDKAGTLFQVEGKK